MLVTMAVIAGCGSDKYVGSWYAIDNMNNPPDAYIRLDIEKNGNGYLLKKNIFRYDRKVVIVNEKEYEEGKKFSSPFMTGEDYAAAMKKKSSAYLGDYGSMGTSWWRASSGCTKR